MAKEELYPGRVPPRELLWLILPAVLLVAIGVWFAMG